MRKYVFILLMVFGVFNLLLGGCAKSTSVQDETIGQEVPDEEISQETPDEEIVLKYSTYGPETINPSSAAKEAAAIIEKRTNGKVKLDMYFSETLLNAPDTFSGVADGIADIAILPVDWIKGVTDLNPIFLRLFEKEPSDLRTITAVYRELLENVPEIQEEMEGKGTRWLDITCLGNYILHTTKKPVRVPKDIKGMNIEVAGDAADWVNSMGGAAVSLPSTADWYMSIERGLVDGQFTHWVAVQQYKTTELFKYHTIFGSNEKGGGVFAPGYGFIINLNTWNSLSPEIQDILVEAFKFAGDMIVSYEFYEQVMEDVIAQARELGNTIITLTPEERQLWAEYMTPINEKWIEDTEAKGWPARKAIEELWRLVEKHGG